MRRTLSRQTRTLLACAILAALAPAAYADIRRTPQKIHITASAAMGADATAANDLDLWICHQISTASVPTKVGLGLFGLTSAANSRQAYTLSAVFAVSTPGTYEVGLCGSSSSSNWTNNDWSYNSVILAN